MTNINTEGLPPEMQARIAQIIEGAKQKVQAESPHQAAIQPPQPVAPPAPPAPSLMDHTIELRQEVAALREQLTAIAQVTDAVGQAVGQLYSMFHQQTQPTSYSAAFQEGRKDVVEESDY